MDGQFHVHFLFVLAFSDLARCHGLGKRGPGSSWLPVVIANNTLSYSQGGRDNFLGDEVRKE